MTNCLNNLYIDIKKLKDIINEAVIVIDTNVLLMAYQWRDITFNDVFEILEELSNEGRLKIPAQVLKEFSNKRPQIIRDLSNDLHNKILSKLERGKSDHHSLDTVIPSLEFFDNKEKLLESEKKYNEALSSVKEAQNEYKKTLSELLVNIKDYLDNDPIIERFKTIFEKSCLDDLELKEEWLKNELEDRKRKSIPPGYRDKGHLGDMIIWSEILKLNENHVIFITRDNKNDWVYKDNTGKVMGARRELVEEFYLSNNKKKTFKIMTPMDFLEIYYKQKGESVKETVRDDIEKTSLNRQDGLTTLERLKNHKLKLEEAYLESYIDSIKEKINLLIGEEITNPEENEYILHSFNKANELKTSDLNRALKMFERLNSYINSILDDVFG